MTIGFDTIKRVVALVLCAAVPIAICAASDNSYKVEYDGGSLPNAKAGTGMRLYIESGVIRIVRDKDKDGSERESVRAPGLLGFQGLGPTGRLGSTAMEMNRHQCSQTFQPLLH
jgi:hypothetical protein